MDIAITPVDREAILPFRDLYRHELHCQIVHDSAHYRDNCYQSYLIRADGEVAGYGSIWLGPYWMPKGSIFEYYVIPPFRAFLFPLFEAFLATAKPPQIHAQTNDPFLGVLIYDYVVATVVGHILFEDQKQTSLPAMGAIFRRARPEDKTRIFEHKIEPVGDWLLEFEGQVVATGGVLYHYNRPYGDIFMEVHPDFRRRGFGSFLVQELKSVCYRSGSIPAARCRPVNIASRRTLERAGFAPCARLISGDVVSRT